MAQIERRDPIKEADVADGEITVNKDGPLKVEGNPTLHDHEGNEIPTAEDRPFFLCRCGASANKPFCDGAHKRIGFSGD
jgi:CDGSH-type Zn-finger protein